MDPTISPWIGTTIFTLAVLHTFCIKVFMRLANRFPSGSVGENLFHLLGEVEVIFGLWGAILYFYLSFFWGHTAAVQFVESSDLTEPLFVFVIMAIASTKPIILFSDLVIRKVGGFIPARGAIGFYTAALVIGPLLGSAITEPGAMTVTALVLKPLFDNPKLSTRFKYVTLGVLFVNVSIGGTLTHFAAPPVVMVARPWGWDAAFMFKHFGDKAILAVLVNTLLASMFFRKELVQTRIADGKAGRTPALMIILHLLFLVFVVRNAHYSKVFMGGFLIFLGFAAVTREYQSQLKLREAALVGFFLAGLVLLGGLQKWWVGPLIQSMGANALYFGATALTAVVDNAALTFLAAQVPDLSDISKYMVVAGAVTGGGLTVIANAPNPIGFTVLKAGFGKDGINPMGLLLGALAPTLIAILCLWGLPV